MVPVVGISTRSVTLPARKDVFRGVFSSYIDCLRSSGAEVVLLPPGGTMTLARLDALMFVGGEDLATTAYWSTGAPVPPVDQERDYEESRLITAAKVLGLPVLGLCRGAQLVNCVLGGTIGRLDPLDLPLHGDTTTSDCVVHLVRVAPNTRLASASGPRDEFLVVSRHAASFGNLGIGLEASAWATDGSIEAIEACDWPFIGVQWHPEWDITDSGPDLALFDWLVDQAKQRIPR